VELLNNAILAESSSIQQTRFQAETFIRFMVAWRDVMPPIWQAGQKH